MFHSIPNIMLDRMKHLEAVDARDSVDGTPRVSRLRQITPDTGKFIALLAATAPEGRFIEIGTSAGYSTLWLALACRQIGRRITTFEIRDEKVHLARETFEKTGVGDVVNLVQADALAELPECKDIAFCFLDAEKEIYTECYDIVVPNLVPGGILVADNATNFEDILRPMLDSTLADNRVDALIVPIGKGELLCRKK